METNNGKYTAMYDCRSKQEYIYRTNKIREISGASRMLSGVYRMFISEAEKHGIRIKNTWVEESSEKKLFDPDSFISEGYNGTVIYEGGGNLNVLYDCRDTYIKANRIFSKMLLERTYSISIIAAGTEYTGDFKADRERLYAEKNRQKDMGTFSVPTSVLPITQTDSTTFLPIAEKKRLHGEYVDMTLESIHKNEMYDGNSGSELSTGVLDSLVLQKGEDSMLAVIYIDGNDMGSKLTACTGNMTDYPGCVTALREFSLHTNEYFVDRPVMAMERCLKEKNDRQAELIAEKPEKAHRYRQIIGGGDEITLICRAEDAMDLVTAYFGELGKTPPLAPGIPNASCAGIAIFHSHAPFADIYEVAESCCESGKKRSRSSGSTVSFIDFHYCSSGITGSLEAIRERQEKGLTKRPYSTEEFKEFIRVGRILSSAAKRSKVKYLGEAAVTGGSVFIAETERLKSRCGKPFIDLMNEYKEKEDELRQLIYDISLVYDLWFKGGNE